MYCTFFSGGQQHAASSASPLVLCPYFPRQRHSHCGSSTTKVGERSPEWRWEVLSPRRCGVTVGCRTRQMSLFNTDDAYGPGALEDVTKYVLLLRRAGSIKERNLRNARQVPSLSSYVFDGERGERVYAEHEERGARGAFRACAYALLGSRRVAAQVSSPAQ